MASMTTVTVATGRELYVGTGQGLTKYVAGDTVSIPTHEAVKQKAAGNVTY